MYLCGLIALYYDITPDFFFKIGARKTLTPCLLICWFWEKKTGLFLQSRLYMAACLEQILFLLMLPSENAH